MRLDAEASLTEALKLHGALVEQCVKGSLNFSEFLDRYDNFYDRYALDGHEDNYDSELLKKLAEPIELHREVTEKVLYKICSEEDALKPEYKLAGRIGPKKAVEILSTIISGGI